MTQLFVYGAVVSGPIIRDKAHFLFSIDRQDRINPVRSLVDDPLVDDITKAELDQFKAATLSTYGYDASNEFGIFDMSGNTWEAVSSTDGMDHFHGGAFDCGDPALAHRCDYDGMAAGPFPATRGFRCCADGEAP